MRQPALGVTAYAVARCAMHAVPRNKVVPLNVTFATRRMWIAAQLAILKRIGQGK